MANKNHFDFDEEADGFSSGDDGFPEDPEDRDVLQASGLEKKSSRTRVLLLLLLLVAAGAGGYFFYFQQPEPPAPAPVAV